jgi:release factor glutamine methyltransferase
MARSIAKGPKPRAGYATVNKSAPKPFAKVPRPAPVQQATTAKSSEPLGTVQVALLRAQKHGMDKLDARMLLLHALGRPTTDMAWLIAHDKTPVSTLQADAFSALCARRRAGEPVAYIVGHKEFYGLQLSVDKRVLDPRADTETLVEWALKLLPIPVGTEPNIAGTKLNPILIEPVEVPRSFDKLSPNGVGLTAKALQKVLDLGTGSGAIALAIQSKRHNVHVSATDASADALAVARANAASLNLPINFYQGSWLQAVPGQRFDIIASNPPYIESADPHLAALQHEPLNALASGPDGLDDIRQIIQEAPAHLQPDGWLLLEHGYNQAAQVRALLQVRGFTHVQSRKDLADIERCSGGQCPAA